jgi:hypothetical protein
MVEDCWPLRPRVLLKMIGRSMAESEFPKRLQLPRILERRRAPADPQLGATHRQSGIDVDPRDSPANEADMRGHRGRETNAAATLKLQKVKRRPSRPLDEIATLIRGLTYGEMIDLSEALWKNRPNGSAATLENLPEMLHRWSASHLAAAHNSAPDGSVLR